MNPRVRLALASVATLAVGLAPGALSSAAVADPAFGEHVTQCALAHHLGATHHPGLHQGAAGWDGTPCHDQA